MKIGELAKQAGISSQTVRYYEGLGLLHEPQRSSSGYRDYDMADAERLTFIRDAQAAGLSLAEIGEILGLKDEGKSTCEHTSTMLKNHLDRVQSQILALQAAQANLQALYDRAASLDPQECRDPQRCQVVAPAAPDNAHGVGGRTRLDLIAH